MIISIIKCIIFISAIIAIIKFSSAALSVNKLMLEQHTALEVNALIWFALVLQNAASGKKITQSTFILSSVFFQAANTF